MDAREVLERYISGDIDFKSVTLCNAKLAGAELIGIRLSGANLQGADLLFAYLTRSQLDGANLSKSKLGGANLNKRTYKRPICETQISTERFYNGPTCEVLI